MLKGATMPQVKQFLVRFFATIGCMLGRKRQTNEDKARAEARASRKAEFDKQKEEDYSTRERVLNYIPHILPKEERTPQQIDMERDWVRKAVGYERKVLKVNSIDNFPRYFEVEVEPPASHKLRNRHCKAFKTFVYAYVESREIKGAVVFIYTPATLENEDDYKAIAFYDNNTILLGAPDTIELAIRLFAPLFNEGEDA